MKIDVSVIIVNWQTKEVLNRCLGSIYKQDTKLEFETIVVDNASSDGSCDMVKQVFPQVRLISNTVNRGYAAALNQGMKIAKGNYFLILNSDVLICDDAIEKTVQYANTNPDVAVVGCQVYETEDKVQMTCFCFPSVLNTFLDALALNRIFSKNSFFGREWMLWWQRDTERDVEVVSGMFMLVRQEAVEQVGLMDERFFLLCEETDWCYRFHRAGWKLFFWPGARIIHMHGGSQSRKQMRAEMMVQFQKSTLLFFRKHYSFTEYVFARILLTFHCLLRTIIWSILFLLRKLSSKDTSYEASKIRGFWLSFLFCLYIYELNTGGKSVISLKPTRIKDLIENICAFLYQIIVLPLQNKRQKVILYYHGVGDGDIDNFTRQMVYLAENCRVVKLSELLNVSSNGRESVLSVTFDDAFGSVLNNAMPILKKYKIPAAVFVPTGNLGEQPKWDLEDDCQDNNEIVMNAGQIKELKKDNFEVFSHTVSHQDLTELNDVDLETELNKSKKDLENIIGHEVCAVSYPYGAFDDRVCRAAEKAGYQFGYSVKPLPIEDFADNFKIGRFSVLPSESIFRFRLKTSGAFKVVHYLRKIKRFIFHR